MMVKDLIVQDVDAFVMTPNHAYNWLGAYELNIATTKQQQQEEQEEQEEEPQQQLYNHKPQHQASQILQFVLFKHVHYFFSAQDNQLQGFNHCLGGHSGARDLFGYHSCCWGDFF